MLKSLEDIISGDIAGQKNKTKTNFDEKDKLAIEKLRNNEIDPEEIAKSLEKHYKGL